MDSKLLKRSKIVDLLKSEPRSEVNVKGWVRTKRGGKNIAFVALNDGSTINNLQLVIDPTKFDEELLRKLSTGAALSATGELVSSAGKGQSVELQVESLELLGEADPNHYPLQKKGHTMEFLREIAHLRPRTNTFSAVLRIRHAMAFAIHKFFNDRGFVYLHTPIITAADAEGAGAMFQVTTLNPSNPPLTEEGKVDYAQDFFGKKTNLTVSGQLEGELGAMALGQIYTFGPTFRAENSNTPRHLSEFWMIEPEMAFVEIEENMDIAEEFIKYLVQYALDHCQDDLKFLDKMIDKGLIERLEAVANTKFARISYTEAIEILLASKVEFTFPLSWGVDLQSEHERYLVEKHFNKPVIVTDYPKEIKAFYMKVNSDGKTVKAMDVLFPKIGEIIGGSEREDSLEKLEERVKEMGMDRETIWWYIETRKYGTAPHSGFGLGFERLLLFVTGMANIRDVIPFPRFPKSAEF